MSAYIVSNKHISALVTAGMAGVRLSTMRWFWPKYNSPNQYEAGQPWGPSHTAILQETENTLTRETAERVGKMLLAENYKSVNHRYNESDGANIEYKYEYIEMNPLSVLSLIAGYEYQSCEHPGWEKSEAKEFCDVLRLRTIRRLPGYSDAPWSI